MTDVATGFVQAMSAFLATRLGMASETAYHDAGSVIDSLHDGVPDNTKPAWEKFKDDAKAAGDLLGPIKKKIDDQTKLIARMAQEAIADAGIDPFTMETAGRIGVRVGRALAAIDSAVRIVATEVSRDAGGTERPELRDQLMLIWKPWAQPFKDLGGAAAGALDAFGDQLGLGGLTSELGNAVEFDPEKFRLSSELASTAMKDFGAVRLNQTKLEVFVSISRREFVNPSEEQKKELIERDGKWWEVDRTVFGLRIFTVIEPGIQRDPLLSGIMPGSKPPKAIEPTAITLDSADGLYLGDGEGRGNERAVLPVQFEGAPVEVREVAIGIVRNKAKEVTGLELTSVVAAKMGGAVGVQVVGAGATFALNAVPAEAAVLPMVVSPRWPDAVGLRIVAGPITGGGFLERKVRTYGDVEPKLELTEFGGVLQLQILKVGVYAIGILTPEDPVQLVLVMGVRFPVAIELSFGFTLNGVGGILALNRRIDVAALHKGMRDHVLENVLFPDDPVAQAPKVLDQLAQVFPPAPGGFVVGPIVELGWGSQAKIVEAKLGIVLSLPDPKIVILGAVRIRAPTKQLPLTDFRCEVFGEISGERLLLIASLNHSKIAGIDVSGELGLLIKWAGGGDFALSVGGFHPKYQGPPDLGELTRLTIDLSPPAVVKIIVKAYFAVTAGAVMAGIRGDLNADVGVASAHAWIQLDVIFRWAPRFGFSVDISVGIEIEVFGCSFAEISFRGSLEGTTPWKIEGRAVVDVWFLPTFELDLGPYSWGDTAEPPPPVAPVAMVAEALRAPEAWKAVLPADGDLLVGLVQSEVPPGPPPTTPNVVAHPLAVLEITQSRLPLETHIDRVGSSPVDVHRVHLGRPTLDAGEVGAVSTTRAPFAPGQFQALDGEALLDRAGFEDLPSGMRVASAGTPVHGAEIPGEVNWRTYVREEEDPISSSFDPAGFNELLVEHALVGRVVEQRENPYIKRTDHVTASKNAISVLPVGSATIRDAFDGSEAVALGVLGPNEAARIADLGARHGQALAAVAVGVT